MIELTSLIEFASEQAGKIFRRQGVIYPLYHAINAREEHRVLQPQSDDKDLSVALIKAWFEIEDIDTYVFIDEAWILDSTASGNPKIDIEKAQREGIRNHPDRREIVMFSAENRRGEQRTAKRFILRPEVGKPTLSPLHFDPVFDHSEGRMVGLLQPRKQS